MQTRDRARQPPHAGSVCIEAPDGRAQPHIDARIEQRGEGWRVANEGFEHRGAVARGGGETLPVMQRNVVAHDSSRHRVFLDKHDADTQSRGFQSGRRTGRAGSHDQKLRGGVDRQLLAGDGFGVVKLWHVNGDPGAGRYDPPARPLTRGADQVQPCGRVFPGWCASSNDRIFVRLSIARPRSSDQPIVPHPAIVRATLKRWKSMLM